MGESGIMANEPLAVDDLEAARQALEAQRATVSDPAEADTILGRLESDRPCATNLARDEEARTAQEERAARRVPLCQDSPALEGVPRPVSPGSLIEIQGGQRLLAGIAD